MKPFRFSLEKVLKVREHQTMLAKHALAEAQLKVGQAWATLEQARLARVQFETEMEEQRSHPLPVQKWQALSEKHDYMALREKGAVQDLHAALAWVTEKRAELEEAERRERTLEKLRDQQFETHRYAELSEEQFDMDEMAANAARNRKGAGGG